MNDDFCATDLDLIFKARPLHSMTYSLPGRAFKRLLDPLSGGSPVGKRRQVVQQIGEEFLGSIQLRVDRQDIRRKRVSFQA